MHYFRSSSIFFVGIFLTLINFSASSPIQARDNQCTACQAIFSRFNALADIRPSTSSPIAVLLPPERCSVVREAKIEAFNTQICDYFNASQANGFGQLVNTYCHQFVQHWGVPAQESSDGVINGGLFEYLTSEFGPQPGGQQGVEILSTCARFRSC